MGDSTKLMKEDLDFNLALTSHLDEGVITFSKLGTITFSNPAAEKLLGYHPGEMLGLHLKTIVNSRPPSDMAHHHLDHPILSVMNSNQESVSGEEDFHRFDRSKFPASYHAAPLIRQGRIEGVVLSFQDNTRIQEIIQGKTRELESAVIMANTANQAKSRFLSNMSHELRTPLNAILGFSELLAEEYVGPLNEKQKEYLTDIVQSGRHLLTLIDDILDLSRFEAGNMEFEPVPIDPRELAEESLMLIRQKALAHDIRLDIDMEVPPDRFHIIGDRRKLKQVLVNLLSNAAKFTPDHGTIRIRILLEELAETTDQTPAIPGGGPWIRMEVEDTGIGIDPEHLENIFQEFFQVQSGLRDKTPGTGLGLALSRRFIQMHDGRLWAESQGLHHGSRFIIQLPVRPHDNSGGWPFR